MHIIPLLNQLEAEFEQVYLFNLQTHDILNMCLKSVSLFI